MNIVVLAGGNSTERDVSLVSGKAVYEALKSKGHKVVLLDVFFGIEDVDVENVFEDKRDWSEGIKKISEENPDADYIKSLKGDDKDFFGKNVREICMKADFVFMALHGANGEDGRIQAALDLMQVKYSGTDYLSSAICMDKSITKELFIMNGIRTPKAVTIRSVEGFEDAVKEIGFPMVVKAPNGGSSVGVFIVDTKEEALNATKECFKPFVSYALEQIHKARGLNKKIVNPVTERLTPFDFAYTFYKQGKFPFQDHEAPPLNLIHPFYLGFSLFLNLLLLYLYHLHFLPL